ncbi:MAG: MBL fold metallo-hydrolase [Balneolaceae bacterium]|nr:MAG: MBL fold metallo-hydrolase [Balneolaceae bacterium]
MIIPDGNLHIFMVNVGQGDTTVIITPKGNVIIADVMRPSKIAKLLTDLGMENGDPIAQLIVSHPHTDHFSGANRLINDYEIRQATVAPFWHTFGMGPPTYQRLIGRFFDKNTNVTFLSGYSRWYPDGAMKENTNDSQPEVNPDAPFFEMLGPTNGLIRMLEDANVFNTNHLSIMLRVRWRNFRMIIGGDAQMENWAFFDQERMLEDKCQVLRTSHHGSSNGTQWERLDRLNPSEVIVSSDPGRGHRIPDLTSSAVFLRYDNSNSRMVVTTADSGTIHLLVRQNGSRTMRCFREAPEDIINLSASDILTAQKNPSDWGALLNQRIIEMG